MSFLKKKAWSVLALNSGTIGILMVWNGNDWGWILIIAAIGISFWRGWVECDPSVQPANRPPKRR